MRFIRTFAFLPAPTGMILVDSGLTTPVAANEYVTDDNGSPYFSSDMPEVVVAQRGSVAFLPCRVHNLGDKSVAWIRNRDQHILTVNNTTFISDARFGPIHKPYLSSWTLRIKYVDLPDAGFYECQISTTPKKSRSIELKIVEPKISIEGSPLMFVENGDGIDFQCSIFDGVETPQIVMWYHNDIPVLPEEKKGKQIPWTIRTDRVSDTEIRSILHLEHVDLKDSGVYFCHPYPHIEPVNVSLRVLVNGEYSAAMQERAQSSSWLTGPKDVILSCAFVISTLPRLWKGS